jgi:exonuclease VII small subunit
MRIIALVFAFALFAGAFAAYTPNRKMSSVLAQVQSLLQTGGPAQAVFDLLDGISEDVRKEQGAHDALHATHQTQCTEELEFRTGEVATAQDAFERSVAQGTKCQTSLSRAEASLEANLHNQEDTRQAIAEKDRLRREEAALYAIRVQQKHDADEAVDEGLRLLDELALGQASLLQVSNAAANMIRKAVTMRQTGAFAPAIAALAQVASNDIYANGDAVERVRELLFKVKDQIQSAFDAYTHAENQAIELYN